MKKVVSGKSSLNPLMSDGNKKVAHVTLSGAGLLKYV